MKQYDILVPLDLCVDFIVDCGEVTPRFGQVEQLVGDYHLELGGSAVIFAAQAAKLGLSVAGLGSVGDDIFGRFVLQKLEETGMDISHIRVCPEIKTGMGLALTKDGGDRAILTYTGSLDGARPEDFTDELLASARHIHIGSYFLMNTLRPAYPDILRRAKALGLSISLDSNWDPAEEWDSGLLSLLDQVDLFFPNRQEAQLIAKRPVKEALSFLRNKVSILAVKNGADGAEAFSAESHLVEPPIAVRPVDTVGAGDNFDAGFVYGWLKGYSLEQCLRAGCITGGKSTEKSGGTAGQIIQSEFQTIMEREIIR